MDDLTKQKIKQVAKIFYEWGEFKTLGDAENTMIKTYADGYPTNAFIDDVLKNKDKLAIVQVMKDGAYNCAWHK